MNVRRLNPNGLCFVSSVFLWSFPSQHQGEAGRKGRPGIDGEPGIDVSGMHGVGKLPWLLEGNRHNSSGITTSIISMSKYLNNMKINAQVRSRQLYENEPIFYQQLEKTCTYMLSVISPRISIVGILRMHMGNQTKQEASLASLGSWLLSFYSVHSKIFVQGFEIKP